MTQQKLPSKGRYRLVGGHIASVLRLRSAGVQWKFLGVIHHDGVSYCHSWDTDGKSHTGDQRMDLAEKLS